MKTIIYFLSAWIFFYVHTVFAVPISTAGVGEVNFSISCQKTSQQQFNHALALMHHMMYQQAENEFTTITKNDPPCAMAYWGIAFSHIHPLWPGEPDQVSLIKGAALLKYAEGLKATEKERAFMQAIDPLYQDWQTTPFRERIAKWEQAQFQLHKKYSDDPEATAFYALAHLATAPKDDKTLSHQKRAGAMLEKLHVQYPSHPGGFHYTIHAYDNPLLANKAEAIARGYDQIAPNVPHALHMPSHIFVRLGLWPETIDWNTRSAEAAKQQPVKTGVMSMHYAHALDYLMYGYLQQADDQQAADVLAKINTEHNYQDSFATAYGIAAARARFYLEQQRWQEGITIPVNQPSAYPWDKYPAVQSMTYFAQGFSAMKAGEMEKAQAAIKALQATYKTLKSTDQNYWAVLVKSKLQTLSAWMELNKGNKTQALTLMRMSADLEDSVDKSPVTPSEVLPARELLGDMLMQLNKPDQALQAYQAALKISPNRFYSLYGAGFAAEKLGDTQTALTYYQKLIQQTNNEGTQRTEVRHAQQYIKQMASRKAGAS